MKSIFKQFIIITIVFFTPMATAEALRPIVTALPEIAFLTLFVIFLTVVYTIVIFQMEG